VRRRIGTRLSGCTSHCHVVMPVTECSHLPRHTRIGRGRSILVSVAIRITGSVSSGAPAVAPRPPGQHCRGRPRWTTPLLREYETAGRLCRNDGEPAVSQSPGSHTCPGITCSASTSAMCFTCRSVKCSICWRHDTPATAIVVSDATSRTRGNSRSSPILRETS
jgi:hypothetical protein